MSSVRDIRKPIMTEHERMDTIISCQYVDEVIPNTGEEDSRQTVEEYHLCSKKSGGRFYISRF